MEMELRSYIKPGLWLKIFLLLFAALLVLGIAMDVSLSGQDDTASAEPFYPVETDTGAYAYVDIVGISDWVTQSDDETYYTVVDNEGYGYTVKMTNSDFRALSDYNAYWNDEDENAIPPEPRRIYGIVRMAEEEMAASIAEAWGYSGSEEYYNTFGDRFLNTTASPSGESSALWTMLALFSGILLICLAVQFIRVNGTANWSLARLEELGSTENAVQDFAKEETQILGKDQARLGEFAVYGKHTGVAIRYEDILWAYRRVTRYYFFAVNEAMIVNTATKKNIILFAKGGLTKDGQESDMTKAFTAIVTHNPEVILGHNRENRKRYQELAKQIKESC